VRPAQSVICATEPRPSPLSPSGTPACADAHETKYAHHGSPGAAPATAERYSASCGPSFEPGGCSVTPTCVSAAARAFEPAYALCHGAGLAGGAAGNERRADDGDGVGVEAVSSGDGINSSTAP